MSDEQQESWEVYPSQLNGTFAMFSVNVAPADDAPFDNLPWINVVRMTGYETAPNGMPASAEVNQELYAIEERLAEMARARGAILVGRLTVAGRRELFFYAASDVAKALVNHAGQAFGDLDFEPLVNEDREWALYLEFLYPEPLDWQRIQNQKVVQILLDGGDDLSRPRKIDHFAYFPDEAARVAFINALGDGFTIDGATLDGERELPFALAFHSVGPADLTSIEKVTIPLSVAAQKVGGNYDGWGCEVQRES